MTKDEMVGWHQRLDEHECEQAPLLCLSVFLKEYVPFRS